jgi:hypothetical protein
VRPARFLIVWLLLVAGFAAAADLVLFIWLQVAHKHVELDYSLLGRFIVAFFGRHITPLLTVTILTNAFRPCRAKTTTDPFSVPQGPGLLNLLVSLAENH